MNTKNFPAKVDARRRSALQRIQAAPSLYGALREEIVENTTAALNSSARDVRSKKDRSGSARLAR